MSTDVPDKRRIREEETEVVYRNLEIYRIDHRRVVFLDEPPRCGGYGVVRKAKLYYSPYLPPSMAPPDYGQPQIVAVKQIKLSGVYASPNAKTVFARELLVWSSINNHPGITKFLGFYTDFTIGEAWFLSPWEAYGNVCEFVSQHELDIPEKLSLVYNVIEALEFLHSLKPPVCHGDIKSANVLVNMQCRAILCDFGLARLYESSSFENLDTSAGFRGSVRWCSPEVLDGKPRTPSSDVYAWAWLMWEIFTGTVPYDAHKSHSAIVCRVLERDFPNLEERPPFKEYQSLRELMKECWAFEPDTRPTSKICRINVTLFPRRTPMIQGVERQSRQVSVTIPSVEDHCELDNLQIDRRRIVFLDAEHLHREGDIGVQKALLHSSCYLPSWAELVYYGQPQTVSVKIVPIPSSRTGIPYAKELSRELTILSRVGAHPGIAKFLGFYVDLEQKETGVLTPWEPYTDIAIFIKNRGLEVPEKLSLIHDTIDALTFLHSQNPPICHGNIKSTNVLVNKELKAVLYDVGLVQLGLEEHSRAPNSDVYSWAWLVWEIMTGEASYEGASRHTITPYILNSPHPQVGGESRLRKCLLLWELMTRCWKVDPGKRPTSSMCLTTVKSLPRCSLEPEGGNSNSRSAALIECLGDLENWNGNYEEGALFLERALKFYQSSKDARGIASVQHKQAALLYHQSQPEESRRLSMSALEGFRSFDNQLGIANASFWLGSALFREGKVVEAMAFIRESLTVFQKEGDDSAVVQCLVRMAEIHCWTASYEAAIVTAKEAIENAKRCGDRRGEASGLLALGGTYSEQGDFSGAKVQLSVAQEVAGQIGWKPGVCTTALRLGDIEVKRGDHKTAEKLYMTSLAAARACGLNRDVARGLTKLSICLREHCLVPRRYSGDI